MNMANPFMPHASKIPGDQGVRVATINICSSKEFTGAIRDDASFKQKQSMLTQSSLLRDVRTDIQANKILSKIRSARNNVAKLFKMNHRVASDVSNLGTFAIPDHYQHSGQDICPSSLLPVLTPQRITSRVRAVIVSGLLPSSKTRLDTIASLVVYSGNVAEQHFEDFVFVLRSAAEMPSPSSSVHLTTAPHFQRSLLSAPPLNRPYSDKEEVKCLKVGVEGAHMEPNGLSVLSMSSSCVPLGTSDSEAKYDAMLATEFAAFSQDPDEILEWSDEVERKKQAKLDAHFAYVSEALAVPVPKLSAYFADSPFGLTDMDTDGSISGPSPLKSASSKTNTSADSSLVTSTDGEGNQPSPIAVRGLRRVRNCGDLKSLHSMTDWSDSCSDLSSWSLDLGLSDSAITRAKKGALRRSVKCNDLRMSFSSLESEMGRSLFREIRESRNQSVRYLVSLKLETIE